MRCNSEGVKAHAMRRMSPLYRQTVAQIPAELGPRIVNLYNWRMAWHSGGGPGGCGGGTVQSNEYNILPNSLEALLI